MGPLFQLGGYLFLHNLFDYHFTIYNYAILYFNLLPIFPIMLSLIVVDLKEIG